MGNNNRPYRNLTISKEQQEFVKANFGKMNISELSKMLGFNYGKVHKNLRLMGLVKTRGEHQAKVVKMAGYFDIDEFAKHYEY